jgi:two-component system KDP operon response regulator KdpE
LRFIHHDDVQAKGFRVIEAATAQRAEIEARSHKPDLVLLDLGLPDADGVSVVEAIRSWSSVPVVVLSARVDEAQKIRALDAGADDYVTKPFSSGELLARIRSALRRAVKQTDSEGLLRLGDVEIDLAQRKARGSRGAIHFTPVEFRLLVALARQCGGVATQRRLLTEVWGPEHVDDTHYLRVYMKQLREKIEAEPANPRFLLTETGVGYRLAAD